jgi:hypothetical protein
MFAAEYDQISIDDIAARVDFTNDFKAFVDWLSAQSGERQTFAWLAGIATARRRVFGQPRMRHDDYK